METLPNHLSAVKPPIEVNECRLYSLEEVKALTGLSVEFWRSEIAAGRIQVGRFGQGSRNDRLRIPHPVLAQYIRDRLEAS